jgi:CRP/FNR family transcriptional regulator, cyclic AMP receptor protein
MGPLRSDSLTSMPIDTSILNEIEHLRELNPLEQAALAEKIDLLVYSADQMVFSYGDPGHALYIVRRGEFEIYVKNDQGEKIVLEISQPGDVFGEVALLDGGSRTAWAAAVGNAEVLRLDREHFEDYLRQCTPAALNLLSVVARRLRKSDEVIRRTVTRNVNDVAAEQETLLTRLADAVPAFTGSVTSLALHALFMAAWIALNLSLLRNIKVFDPFPFEFLSVIVSLEAIFLTLFVLTSQNRQRSRDRIRSDIEFESSINTETKIAYLHEKIDKLTEGHYQLLVNTQKLLDQTR